MFYGEFKHGIDRKGRLILPSKFRETCKEYGVERFFLTRGLDRCIFMFSEDEWRTQEQKFKNMPFTKQQSRGFNRLFFSGAVDVRPDKQGRFIIPNYLNMIDQQLHTIKVFSKSRQCNYKILEGLMLLRILKYECLDLGSVFCIIYFSHV